MSDFFDDAEAFRSHQYTATLHRRGQHVIARRAFARVVLTLCAFALIVLVSR